MKFPGNNSITLSSEALDAMLRDFLDPFEGQELRVTYVTYSYYGGDMQIDFTSDPDPEQDTTEAA